MTQEEISPYVGTHVSVSLATGQIVTGTLAVASGKDAYRLLSIDGETPPISLNGAQISSIDR